jgi:beta-glucosidase
MTDWWMRSSKSPEFPQIKDQAYRVRAGVNVLMPGGNRAGVRKPDGSIKKAIAVYEGLTAGELQQNAIHVLNFVMNSNAMNR